jgi:GTP-binding protein
VIVAATKIDKLARTRAGAALRAVEEALGLPRGDVVPFSAVEGTGADALWARIAAIAAEAAPAPA